MQFVVFDHKGSAGALHQWAMREGIPLVADPHVGRAVAALVADDADVVFIHLDDAKAWNNLIDGVAESRAVFRLSSVGFAPTKPMGKGQNCFHVNPPTTGSGALSADQLSKFRDSLTEADVLPALMAGQIPGAIRSFIWFEEPHLARALHIFIQGRLAQWALDPGHPLRAQASKVVGFDEVSMLSSRDFDWNVVLRKMLESGSPTDKDETENNDPLIANTLARLRDELSQRQRKDSNGTPIDEAPINEVGDLLKKWLGTTPSSDHAKRIEQDIGLFSFVETAFNALDTSLGRTKEGAA